MKRIKTMKMPARTSPDQPSSAACKIKILAIEQGLDNYTYARFNQASGDVEMKCEARRWHLADSVIGLIM